MIPPATSGVTIYKLYCFRSQYCIILWTIVSHELPSGVPQTLPSICLQYHIFHNCCCNVDFPISIKLYDQAKICLIHFTSTRDSSWWYLLNKLNFMCWVTGLIRVVEGDTNIDRYQTILNISLSPRFPQHDQYCQQLFSANNWWRYKNKIWKSAFSIQNKQCVFLSTNMKLLFLVLPLMSGTILKQELREL